MLNKIQSLIDAGNTVVYQCVKYKYAFVIERVITASDNDLSIGFKHRGCFSRPYSSACKQSIGSEKSVAKFFLVQTGEKEYEVFDTEKNYRSGKRTDKVDNYDELRALYNSQVVHTFTFKQNLGRQVIDRSMSYTRPCDMEMPDPLNDDMFKQNYNLDTITDFKYVGAIPVSEYEDRI
jgi:hypothetical protein